METKTMKKVLLFTIVLIPFLIVFILLGWFFYELVHTEWSDNDTKKLITEIKTGDASYCETLPETAKVSASNYLYARTACFSLFAQYKNNPNLCNKISKDYQLGYIKSFGRSFMGEDDSFVGEKTDCLLRSYLINKDKSICNLSNNQREKDNCLGIIADITDDLSLCKNIENKYKYVTCYNRLSQGMMCEKLSYKNEDIEKYCYEELFVKNFSNDNYKLAKNFNISICDKITTSESQAFCQVFFVTTSKNPDDCTSISPPEETHVGNKWPDYCYIKKAQFNADKQYCSYIKDETIKRGCLLDTFSVKYSYDKEINYFKDDYLKKIAEQIEKDKKFDIKRFVPSNDM